MNKNVLFALKWGLLLGVAVVGAQIALARAQKSVLGALPAPGLAGGNGQDQAPTDDTPTLCQINPNDPLCTSFGGPGEAWM